MKHRDRSLAGTAIGILMAASSAGAYATQVPSATAKVEQKVAPIVLAQAAGEDQEKTRPEVEDASRPAEPEAAEEQPAQPELKPAEEQAAQPQPEPAEEPARGESKGAEEPPQAEPKAAEESVQQEPKATEDEAAKPAPEATAEPPRTEPKATEKPAEAESKAEGQPAQPEPKAAGEEAVRPEPKTAEESAGAEPKATEPDRAKPKAADEPAPTAPDAAEEPAQPEPKAAGEETRPRPEAAESGQAQQPSGEAGTTGEQREQKTAPMLDSQKDAAQGAESEAGPARRAAPARDAERKDSRRHERAKKRPESDQAAQRDIDVSIEDVRKLDQEKGRRVDRKQFGDFRRRDGAKVVKKLGDRSVIQFNNQIIVEDDSHERIRRHARDVYYEVLPNELRREVVVRPNGTKIVTVRNSYGDIVSRTRIVNGRQYVLVYAGDNRRQWHDPAEDLPPLRIDIPRSEYILEAEQVNDPDRYYRFLDQPPVVPVEQLYTIDQVRYSARVRDMVRRVDLDTINFETGSADITRNEMPDLEALATAIRRMIDDNPAETFLIEGHTDAVGSEQSNLVLSDERAESVAAALTDVYDIPPENLFTQGYGEQYLKVETEGPSRENRRVAVRRITPLVSPVASARQ